MKIRINPVVLVCALTVGTTCVAGEFVPGHVYVAVRAHCEGNACDWIVQVDPDTGETTLLADSETDVLWQTNGLAFTPRTGEGIKLRGANNEAPLHPIRRN